MEKTIEIPFGTKDSELKGWEYTIPENMEAEIKDGKIIVREKEGDDERIRKDLITFICQFAPEHLKVKYVAYLEKQKDFDKAMSAIEKIDRYIDSHTANAHDMDDSNPDKKYYSGVDDTLSNIAGILNGVYSEEEQKEQKPMHFLEIPAGDIAPAEEDGPFDEDEFLDGELSAFLQNYDKEYDDDAAVSDVARHFYEIGKKQKEQQPASGNSEKPNNHAEWSEEDEALLKEIVSFFKDGTTKLQHDLDLYAGFLEKKFKSLRPQPHWKPSEEQKEPKLESCDCSRDEESYTNGIHHVLMNPEAYGLIKQKPAEWSEADKLHLNNAILVAKKEWGVNSYTARWLESLRDNYKKCNSHWKPSEEQMEAVEEALEFYSGITATAKGLRSLYNDLKKL